MTRWTRLEGSPVWDASRHAHGRGRFRLYHDWDRLLRIYTRAGAELRLPYDRALDLAVLSHSVVIHPGRDRRARSAAWLRSHAGQDEPAGAVDAACRMILAGPYEDLSDPRLPLLELSDLADPGTANAAVRDLMGQVLGLTGLSREEVEIGMLLELVRIRRALRSALPRIEDPDLRGLADRILLGAVLKGGEN